MSNSTTKCCGAAMIYPSADLQLNEPRCSNCGQVVPPEQITKDVTDKLLGLCGKCRTNPAQPEHACPYKADIHNDSETLCDCCDECEHQCAMDI